MDVSDIKLKADGTVGYDDWIKLVRRGLKEDYGYTTSEVKKIMRKYNDTIKGDYRSRLNSFREQTYSKDMREYVEGITYYLNRLVRGPNEKDKKSNAADIRVNEDGTVDYDEWIKLIRIRLKVDFDFSPLDIERIMRENKDVVDDNYNVLTERFRGQSKCKDMRNWSGGITYCLRLLW